MARVRIADLKLEIPPDAEFGNLTRSDVEEYQRIIREETGETLTLEEAWAQARAVSTLYRQLLSPIPEDPEAQARVERAPEPKQSPPPPVHSRPPEQLTLS